MEPVALQTPRLELSVPTGADVDAIFEACQDAAIERYVALPSPYERTHAEGFIPLVAEHWQSDSEYTWAVRGDGRLAGMIALLRTDVGSAERSASGWSPPPAVGGSSPRRHAR